MNYADFLKKDQSFKKTYLKHACWVRRCYCKEYGFPWDSSISVLANGLGEEPIVHTEKICCPMSEYKL